MRIHSRTLTLSHVYLARRDTSEVRIQRGRRRRRAAVLDEGGLRRQQTALRANILQLGNVENRQHDFQKQTTRGREVPTWQKGDVPRGGVVRDHERERQQDRPLGPEQVARIRGPRHARGHEGLRGAPRRHHAGASQLRAGAGLRRGAPSEPRGERQERPAQSRRRAQAAEAGRERAEARRRRRRGRATSRTFDGTFLRGRCERARRRRRAHRRGGRPGGRRAARRFAGRRYRRYRRPGPAGKPPDITRGRCLVVGIRVGGNDRNNSGVLVAVAPAAARRRRRRPTTPHRAPSPSTTSARTCAGAG